MDNNLVLRSLRYSLNLSNNKVIKCFESGGILLAQEDLDNLLKKDEEEGFVACSDLQLLGFLNGLILIRRGPSDRAPIVEKRITNNIIMKKIRVALELHEKEMFEIFALSEFNISKGELSALFRNPEHKNYKECGDQVLRRFLKGLTLKYRQKK